METKVLSSYGYGRATNKNLVKIRDNCRPRSYDDRLLGWLWSGVIVGLEMVHHMTLWAWPAD